MADLVLWKPAFFGAKPEMVIKGGQIAWSKMGMANASLPTTQPVKMRKMFGAYGKCIGNNSVVFVSQLSVDKKTVESYGISKEIVPVVGCRNISKKDMILNDSCPNLRIDPETYRVTIEDEQEDGQKEETHLTCPPANSLPLAQRYFIF